MSLNDPLANALSSIMNHEKVGKDGAVIKPVSKVVVKVLSIMQDHKYLGESTRIKDSKGDVLKVNLLGNINRCGVIKPRFASKVDQYERFEKRYLPARNVGKIIVSTSEGIMTHDEAKKKGLGGKLIAYFY